MLLFTMCMRFVYSHFLHCAKILFVALDASGPEDADVPLSLVEEDPAELELQKQLDRQRKLQQRIAMQDAAEKVRKMYP